MFVFDFILFHISGICINLHIYFMKHVFPMKQSQIEASMRMKSSMSYEENSKFLNFWALLISYLAPLRSSFNCRVCVETSYTSLVQKVSKKFFSHMRAILDWNGTSPSLLFYCSLDTLKRIWRIVLQNSNTFTSEKIVRNNISDFDDK